MSADNETISITESASPVATEPSPVPDPPLSLEKKAYLFNQFYFDLLKKLKKHAKQNKEKSKEARNILRSIKNSYISYETGSVEYIQKFEGLMIAEFWKNYCECPVESVNKFLLSEQAFDAYVYNQISVDMIAVCLNDTFVLHHYLTIFAILMQDMTENDVTRAMAILKRLKEKDISQEFESISHLEARKWVQRLYTIYTTQMASAFGDKFADIESTSLGKLAKEIMEEVDLTNLQNSINSDGDVFRALTDPNSGIANLLGTVSQKMISKLASGEIKQENLLEDAMKFASKLPGLSGQGGAGLNLGNMGSMMQNMMGALSGDDTSGGGGVDMASLMGMVQGMMGNGGRSQAQAASAAKSALSNARKSAQIKKMRDKMKKRPTKENIPDQVE